MRILLVEDDRKLCDTLKYQLERENLRTDVCEDGFEGLELIRSRSHDLILLDRMLPSMDGVSVLRTVRSEGITTPVIFLTALGELGDKITGLDCGADDYMVKPFAFEELMARIRSVVRRPRDIVILDELKLGDLCYDMQQNILTGPKSQCSLSKREGDLMELFLRNAGQTLPRATILSRVWGPGTEVEDGNLDNYIHFVRRRLAAVESTVKLQTVRGIGYRLEDTHV